MEEDSQAGLAVYRNLRTKTKEELLANPPEEFSYEEIDKEFECAICCWPFSFPMTHQKCGHSFCSECIKGVPKCPMCREDLVDLSVVRILLTCLERMVVICETCKQKLPRGEFVHHYNTKCPIPCENGCGTVVYRNAVAQHCEVCPELQVKCPSNSCKVHLPRREIPDHVDKCPYVLCECDYCAVLFERQLMENHQNLCEQKPRDCDFSCGIKVKKKDKETHYAECPMVPKDCPAKSLGCDFSSSREKVSIHEKSCILISLKPALVQRDQEIQKLIDKLNQQQNLIATLQENILKQQELFQQFQQKLCQQNELTNNLSVAVESVKAGDIFNWLGTKGKKREYMNPILDNIISVSASSLSNEKADLSVIINKESKSARYFEKPFTTREEPNSWILFDFRCYVLKPKAFYIRSNNLWTWMLQGSNDNINWDILKEVKQDLTVLEKSTRLSVRKYYRFIRLLQNGVNRDGRNSLSLFYCNFSGNILYKESMFM